MNVTLLYLVWARAVNRQGYLQVAFRDLSSRLRRSLRGSVEIVAGFQPATISTLPLNAGPLAGRHEQKDDL